MLIFQGVLYCVFFFGAVFFLVVALRSPKITLTLAPENRPKLTPKRKPDPLPSINFQELLLLVWGRQIFFFAMQHSPLPSNAFVWVS